MNSLMGGNKICISVQNTDDQRLGNRKKMNIKRLDNGPKTLSNDAKESSAAYYNELTVVIITAFSSLKN